MLVVFWQKQRECEQSRVRKRGRERIPSRLHTVSTEPPTGLELRNHEIMTWAKTKSWPFNQLSHPRDPVHYLLRLLKSWDSPQHTYQWLSKSWTNKKTSPGRRVALGVELTTLLRDLLPQGGWEPHCVLAAIIFPYLMSFLLFLAHFPTYHLILLKNKSHHLSNALNWPDTLHVL